MFPLPWNVFYVRDLTSDKLSFFVSAKGGLPSATALRTRFELFENPTGKTIVVYHRPMLQPDRQQGREQRCAKLRRFNSPLYFSLLTLP